VGCALRSYPETVRQRLSYRTKSRPHEVTSLTVGIAEAGQPTYARLTRISRLMQFLTRRQSGLTVFGDPIPTFGSSPAALLRPRMPVRTEARSKATSSPPAIFTASGTTRMSTNIFGTDQQVVSSDSNAGLPGKLYNPNN
jgi:hypothetical protein